MAIRSAFGRVYSQSLAGITADIVESMQQDGITADITLMSNNTIELVIVRGDPDEALCVAQTVHGYHGARTNDRTLTIIL